MIMCRIPGKQAAEILVLVTAVLAALAPVISVPPVWGAQYPLEDRVGLATEGFVSGPNLLHQGNTYTLTGNIFEMIDVHESNIVIDGAGFTIEHNETTYDNHGIFIRFQNNVTIKNVTIKGFGTGVYGYASNSLITQCIITNCSQAIDLHDSPTNTISNNTLIGNKYGFSVSGDSADNLFTNNTLHSNEWPFGTMDIAMHNSITQSNKVNGKSTYCIVNQTGLVVSPASYPDIGYLAIVNSIQITVKDLTITDNPTFTLTLLNTTNSTIANNTFTYTWRAIYLNESNNNTIAGNFLANNRYGMFLEASSCIITENTIQNNTNGISFIGANSVGTPNETVYHNNFIGNEEHVSPYNRQLLDFSPPHPESYWDNGKEGNFWSNYNGTDTNGDGIGDTAYLASIYHNITDRYPLTHPFALTSNSSAEASPSPSQNLNSTENLPPSSSPAQPTVSPSSSSQAIVGVGFDWVPYAIAALAIVCIVGLVVARSRIRKKAKVF